MLTRQPKYAVFIVIIRSYGEKTIMIIIINDEQNTCE